MRHHGKSYRVCGETHYGYVVSFSVLEEPVVFLTTKYHRSDVNGVGDEYHDKHLMEHLGLNNSGVLLRPEQPLSMFFEEGKPLYVVTKNFNSAELLKLGDSHD